MIADAQVHLWLAEGPQRPWLPGRTAQLPHPFTIEQLLPMMDAAGVERAVVVPPSWEGDRNDYALAAAAKFPHRFAVMGRIPLSDPRAAALMPMWKQQPGMLGIRLTFHDAQVEWLTDGTADWLWPLAEKHRIPIMYFRGPAAVFAGIAERHPQLQLIVDHFGVTAQDAKEDKIAAAISDTVGLAKYQNVSVKVSSSPYYSAEAYPFRDMTVHIRRVFDAYGPRRCYWGTDLTNSFNKATYRQRVSHFTEQLDFLSEDDKQWVMGRAILERLSWAA